MLCNSLYKDDLRQTILHSVGIERLAGKKILITGGTGTIGSWLVDTLVEYNLIYNQSIDIYVAGRSTNKLKENYDALKSPEWIHFVQYDLFKNITFDFPVNYVIHAAGNAHPQAFNSDPVGTIMGNVCGTYNLLQYASTHGAERFLYISSGEVYGKGDLSFDSFPENYGGYVDPVAPRSSYPNSKRVTETLCISYWKQYGLENVIVRPSHTYGPVITDHDNRANAEFIQKAVAGQNIVMKTRGLQQRSYTYMADCASAILTVLNKGSAGEAYNIANKNSRCTISGFAEKLAAIANVEVCYGEPAEKERDSFSPIPKQVLDSTKLEKLGWNPRFSLDMGIKHVYEILKSKDAD